MIETFEWWGVMDAGLVFNLEVGCEVWKPGDIVQAHVMIGEVEVWAEYDATLNQYRLGRGSAPLYGRLLSQKEFYATLEWLTNWTGARITVPEVVIDAEVCDV